MSYWEQTLGKHAENIAAPGFADKKDPDYQRERGVAGREKREKGCK